MWEKPELKATDKKGGWLTAPFSYTRKVYFPVYEKERKCASRGEKVNATHSARAQRLHKVQSFLKINRYFLYFLLKRKENQLIQNESQKKTKTESQCKVKTIFPQRRRKSGQEFFHFFFYYMM